MLRQILNPVAWQCWPSHILCLAQLLCPQYLTNSIEAKSVHMKCLELSLTPDYCQCSGLRSSILLNAMYLNLLLSIHYIYCYRQPFCDTVDLDTIQ